MLEEARQVLWTQGLFLQPHHFQVADMAVDSRLRALRRASSPWYWGFKSLTISEDALLNNQIGVTSLAAVFQDGTEISFPGNAVLRPRSFESAWTQADRPFMVYLGLRRFNPDQPNVHSHEEGADVGEDQSFSRFSSSYTPEPATDIYGDAQPEPVRRLSYSPGLFWESEIKEYADFDFLPLARLIHIGDKPVLDAGFIPPSLDMHAFASLRQTLLDIRDQLLGRAARLEEYKPARGKNDQWSGDQKVFGMLLTLLLMNRNIPVLNFAAEIGGVPPWTAYMYLRQLAAELSSLVPGINALGESYQGDKLIAEYNHADPWPCFQQAHQLISQLLSSLSSGPEHMIRLEKTQRDMYAATPPEAFFAPDMHYYLMIRTSQKLEIVREDVARFGKLSSLNSLKYLIAQALPGVPVRQVDSPPIGLPRRNDTAYFEINGNSPLWKEVLTQDDKAIAFFWQGGSEDAVLHLVAMKSK